MASEWRRRRFHFLVNLYGPYLGAGIRVTRVAPGFASVDVEMRMKPWNRNYVGTHFGGSLFAMADPFFMILLIEQLGPAYVVWDKAAAIRFRKPGRGTVRARFEIPPARLDEIRAAADREGATEPTFTVEIRDTKGDVVAEVDKVISVRRKDAPRGAKR
jgi:acyl-coenzyme A thioesterase PaaI-like protein